MGTDTNTSKSLLLKLHQVLHGEFGIIATGQVVERELTGEISVPAMRLEDLVVVEGAAQTGYAYSSSVPKAYELSSTMHYKLQSEDDLRTVVHILTTGHEPILVVDFGSTYGLTFLPKCRHEVAHLRRESIGGTGELETASLAARSDIVVECLPDHDKELHAHLVRRMTNVGFTRFLPKESPRIGADVKRYCLSPHGKIQMYPLDGHPLFDLLAEVSSLGLLCVRSANYAGRREQPFPGAAHLLAQQMGVPLVSLSSAHVQLTRQDEVTVDGQLPTDRWGFRGGPFKSNGTNRKRCGSVPIVAIGEQRTSDSEYSQVGTGCWRYFDGHAISTTAPKDGIVHAVLDRFGNVDPQVMMYMFRDIVLQYGITIAYHLEEERGVGKAYRQYYVPLQLRDGTMNDLSGCEIQELLQKAALFHPDQIRGKTAIG